MQRFILQQNIAHFRERLSEARDEATRERIRGMLLAAEREFALVNSAMTGAHPRPVIEPVPEATRTAMIDWFRKEFGASPKLAALYDPDPGLFITAVNATFLVSSGRTREQVEGQPLFLVFPDNVSDPGANGVANLYASLRTVAETRREHAMALQRYDVRRPDGLYQERWWRPVNSPLHDEAGRLVFVLHLVDEASPP